MPLCSQGPRKLRSAFIKAEDQAADNAAAEDDGLDDMAQIPAGRQTRQTLELRRLKQASRLADSEDAADEVEDADEDDPDAQVCDLHPCGSSPSLWSMFTSCSRPASHTEGPSRSTVSSCYMEYRVLRILYHSM